jgi:hypothetical protein
MSDRLVLQCLAPGNQALDHCILAFDDIEQIIRHLTTLAVHNL